MNICRILVFFLGLSLAPAYGAQENEIKRDVFIYNYFLNIIWNVANDVIERHVPENLKESAFQEAKNLNGDLIFTALGEGGYFWTSHGIPRIRSQMVRLRIQENLERVYFEDRPQRNVGKFLVRTSFYFALSELPELAACVNIVDSKKFECFPKSSHLVLRDLNLKIEENKIFKSSYEFSRAVYNSIVRRSFQRQLELHSSGVESSQNLVFLQSEKFQILPIEIVQILWNNLGKYCDEKDSGLVELLTKFERLCDA